MRIILLSAGVSSCLASGDGGGHASRKSFRRLISCGRPRARPLAPSAAGRAHRGRWRRPPRHFRAPEIWCCSSESLVGLHGGLGIINIHHGRDLAPAAITPAWRSCRGYRRYATEQLTYFTRLIARPATEVNSTIARRLSASARQTSSIAVVMTAPIVRSSAILGQTT